MVLRTYGTLCAWGLVLLLMAPALGNRRSTPLQPGDTLPDLAGRTLSGKPLDLPAAARGEVAVVIFSFSRSGGRDARDWAQHLSKNYPHLDVSNAIFLDAAPRLFRGMVVSEIRSGMTSAVRDRTMILYEQQSSWEERLHVTDENFAVVVVLGGARHIGGMASGPFAEVLYRQIRQEIGHELGASPTDLHFGRPQGPGPAPP